MQIENTNTCIISGGTISAPKKQSPEKEKPKKHVHLPRLPKIERAVPLSSAFVESLKEFLRDFAAVVKIKRKKFLCAAAGAAVTVSGLAALGTYCTIGVNYYYGGELLCTVAATDDAAAIIGSAAEKAGLLGAPEPEIETSAKLALKSDLVEGDEAVDTILAASPYLCMGYIVSVDGIDLFVAESREDIDLALDEYVQKYKLNDSASLSASIDIREQIVRQDEITPFDYITSLLEEGGVLTVTNTVDITEQRTITHETSEIADDSLYVGETVVETEGADGTLVTVNEQIYSNGELLSSAVISSETTLEPVTEVIRVGTKLRNALEDGLTSPLTGTLTSSFGERWGRQHRGVDIAVSTGTPVAAAASGTVITAEYKESYGNLVQIDHGYGIITSYAHLDSIAVSVGQQVSRGETVAYSGNTGNSTGPHLHFEVINNGEYLNPLDYII